MKQNGVENQNLSDTSATLPPPQLPDTSVKFSLSAVTMLTLVGWLKRRRKMEKFI